MIIYKKNRMSKDLKHCQTHKKYLSTGYVSQQFVALGRISENKEQLEEAREEKNVLVEETHCLYPEL